MLLLRKQLYISLGMLARLAICHFQSFQQEMSVLAQQ